MYLGFNHQTKELELKQTADVAWFWKDMKIQAKDKSPSQQVCLGSNMQVVSCDIAARVILQTYEEELYSQIKEMNNSLKITLEQLTVNLTGKLQESSVFP